MGGRLAWCLPKMARHSNGHKSTFINPASGPIISTKMSDDDVNKFAELALKNMRISRKSEFNLYALKVQLDLESQNWLSFILQSLWEASFS